MFETLEMAPPDPILGLTEAFNKDPNPRKINLGVGVYKDAQGKTPVLKCVKAAERKLAETEATKNYLPMTGSPEYDDAVQTMLFGAGHEILQSNRAQTAHTPGGTGGLRVVGDYLKRTSPGATIWLSKPTWPNHPGIFQAAGVSTREYPYFDAKRNALDFDAMIDALKQAPAGDVVLLHGCCHNPTGVDPTPQQWKVIGDVLHDRGLIALIDFAYQGFADGLEEDAAGLRELARPGCEMFIVSSFSKNFGLYRERTGAVTIVAADEAQAQIAMSHMKLVIRTNYSNPPSHGGAVVATILNDAQLTAQWHEELKAMRDRINGTRQQFVQTLGAKGVERDFSFIAQQRGMFSFSGLTPEQVKQLRDSDAIYIVGSGRINVAGMTPDNMDPLCEAIARVL